MFFSFQPGALDFAADGVGMGMMVIRIVSQRDLGCSYRYRCHSVCGYRRLAPFKSWQN